MVCSLGTVSALLTSESRGLPAAETVPLRLRRSTPQSRAQRARARRLMPAALFLVCGDRPPVAATVLLESLNLSKRQELLAGTLAQ